MRRRMHWMRRWRGLPLAALLWHSPLQAAECQRAAERAEQEAGLPAGLLQAIGQVESGGWPWTVGEVGAGRTFPVRDAAVEWVEQRQAAGVRSVDIGCFQLNLLYHPTAFATLADAFDPDVNARAAAAYLLALHARLPQWGDVVGAYHSETPDLGNAYRARVLAWWHSPGLGAPGAAPAATAVAFASLRFLPGFTPPADHLPRILRGSTGEAGGEAGTGRARLLRLVP